MRIFGGFGEDHSEPAPPTRASLISKRALPNAAHSGAPYGPLARAALRSASAPRSRGARSCTWKAQPPKAPNCSYVRTTQNERSSGFTTFVTTLASAPFVVGFHWWQWVDEPGGSGGRWPDGENSNYGLVHLDDDAYGLLTEEMARTNAKIDAIHA